MKDLSLSIFIWLLLVLGSGCTPIESDPGLPGNSSNSPAASTVGNPTLKPIEYMEVKLSGSEMIAGSGATEFLLGNGTTVLLPVGNFKPEQLNSWESDLASFISRLRQQKHSTKIPFSDGEVITLLSLKLTDDKGTITLGEDEIFFSIPAGAIPSNSIPSNATEANSDDFTMLIETMGYPDGAIPSNALPSNALPSRAIPSNIVAPNALPSNALPSNIIGNSYLNYSYNFSSFSTSDLRTKQSLDLSSKYLNSLENQVVSARLIVQDNDDLAIVACKFDNVVAEAPEKGLAILCPVRGTFKAPLLTMILTSTTYKNFMTGSIDDQPFFLAKKSLDLGILNRPPLVEGMARDYYFISDKPAILRLAASDQSDDLLFASITIADEGNLSMTSLEYGILALERNELSTVRDYTLTLEVRDDGFPRKTTGPYNFEIHFIDPSELDQDVDINGGVSVVIAGDDEASDEVAGEDASDNGGEDTPPDEFWDCTAYGCKESSTPTEYTTYQACQADCAVNYGFTCISYLRQCSMRLDGVYPTKDECEEMTDCSGEDQSLQQDEDDQPFQTGCGFGKKEVYDPCAMVTVCCPIGNDCECGYEN